MPDPKKIHVDDSFVLDMEQTTLTKNEKEIHLTPKEAKLMAVLLENVGRVVSRDELIRAVWQTENLSKSRSLDVHICWLRRKVEDNPASPQHILTQRGLGYELRL